MSHMKQMELERCAYLDIDIKHFNIFLQNQIPAQMFLLKQIIEMLSEKLLSLKHVFKLITSLISFQTLP